MIRRIVKNENNTSFVKMDTNQRHFSQNSFPLFNLIVFIINSILCIGNGEKKATEERGCR